MDANVALCLVVHGCGGARGAMWCGGVAWRGGCVAVQPTTHHPQTQAVAILEKRRNDEASQQRLGDALHELADAVYFQGDGNAAAIKMQAGSEVDGWCVRSAA